MTGLSLREKGQLIPLARVSADVNEKQRPASLLLDRHAGTGWGVTADEERDAPTLSSCS